MAQWTIKPYNPEQDYLDVCAWIQGRTAQTLGQDGYALDRWQTQFSARRMHGKENHNALIFEKQQLVAVIVFEASDEVHCLQLVNNEALLFFMLDWLTIKLAGTRFSTWSACHDLEQTAQLQAYGFTKQNERCCIHTFKPTHTLKVAKLAAGFSVIEIDVNDSNMAQQQASIDRECFPWAQSTASFVQDSLEMPAYRKAFHQGVLNNEGELVAFSILWLDFTNSIAVFEPVATRPEFQQQGLAKALMRTLINQAYSQFQISSFLVGSYTPTARTCYESVGFNQQSFVSKWTYQSD